MLHERFFSWPLFLTHVTISSCESNIKPEAENSSLANTSLGRVLEAWDRYSRLFTFIVLIGSFLPYQLLHFCCIGLELLLPLLIRLPRIYKIWVVVIYWEERGHKARIKKYSAENVEIILVLMMRLYKIMYNMTIEKFRATKREPWTARRVKSVGLDEALGLVESCHASLNNGADYVVGKCRTYHIFSGEVRGRPFLADTAFLSPFQALR